MILNRCWAGVLDAVGVPINRCRNGRLDHERSCNPDDGLVPLRAIDKDLFIWRLIVGDALEGDMWNDAPDLIALSVLSSLVDKAPDGSPRFVLESIVGKGSG